MRNNDPDYNESVEYNPPPTITTAIVIASGQARLRPHNTTQVLCRLMVIIDPSDCVSVWQYTEVNKCYLYIHTHMCACVCVRV